MHSEVYKSILEIHPWSPFAAITKGMVPWPHDFWPSAPPWRLGAPWRRQVAEPLGGQDAVSTGLTRCRVKNMESMTLVKPRWGGFFCLKVVRKRATFRWTRLNPCQSQRLRYWPDMMKYVDYTSILSDSKHQQAQPPRESLVGRSSYDRCFAQWLNTGHKKINLRLFRPALSYLAMISRKSI